MATKPPTQEAVDHIRFQLDLLRLCAVPALSKSVKPETIAETQIPQEQALEELVKVGS